MHLGCHLFKRNPAKFCNGHMLGQHWLVTHILIQPSYGGMSLAMFEPLLGGGLLPPPITGGLSQCNTRLLAILTSISALLASKDGHINFLGNVGPGSSNGLLKVFKLQGRNHCCIWAVSLLLQVVIWNKRCSPPRQYSDIIIWSLQDLGMLCATKLILLVCTNWADMLFTLTLSWMLHFDITCPGRCWICGFVKK